MVVNEQKELIFQRKEKKIVGKPLLIVPPAKGWISYAKYVFKMPLSPRDFLS